MLPQRVVPVMVHRRHRRRRLLPTAFLGVALFATTFLVSVSHHHHQLMLLWPEQLIMVGSDTPVRVPHRRLRSPEDHGRTPLHVLSLGGAGYAEMISDRILPDSYMDLAVACTQSMIGDAVEYDAVTIPLRQRGTNQQLWLDDHTRVLLDRIRKRFPKAVIVLVELEPLTSLTLYPTVETYQQWHDKRIQSLDSSSNVASDTERAQAMIDDAAKVKGNWIWRYSSPTSGGADEDQRLLERRRNDPLLVTYRLSPPTFRIVSDVVDFIHLFSPDGRSLSQSGHLKVADDIRSLIQTTLERR
jgi:hypothetical protein